MKVRVFGTDCCLTISTEGDLVAAESDDGLLEEIELRNATVKVSHLRGLELEELDPYKEPNAKGFRHRESCLHDEPGVTICVCDKI